MEDWLTVLSCSRAGKQFCSFFSMDDNDNLCVWMQVHTDSLQTSDLDFFWFVCLFSGLSIPVLYFQKVLLCWQLKWTSGCAEYSQSES